MTRRAGVLGRPIGHSLSPVIHQAGYAAAGLDGWSYTAHECGVADLPGFVAGLGAEWAGLSLTMPLKVAALDVASEVSPAAAAIGAANTLVRRGGARRGGATRYDGATWYAENTDAPGMVDALRWASAGRPGGTGTVSAIGAISDVAVLGAGGTARACLAAAQACGASVVSVYARRREAVEELRPAAAALGLTLVAAPWAQAARAGAAQLVISTVPAGVADSCAAALAWRPGGVLVDVVYDPWPTRLSASAAQAGWRVVSGLDLLLAQAARQFQLFTGVPAPVAAMRQALDGALAQRTTV
jgi:shikimate-5-dehydrogenase